MTDHSLHVFHDFSPTILKCSSDLSSCFFITYIAFWLNYFHTSMWWTHLQNLFPLFLPASPDNGYYFVSTRPCFIDKDLHQPTSSILCFNIMPSSLQFCLPGFCRIETWIDLEDPFVDENPFGRPHSAWFPWFLCCGPEWSPSSIILHYVCTSFLNQFYILYYKC